MNYFIINILVNLVLKLGGQTTKVLDKGSIELVGPFGLEKSLLKLSKIITSLSTGIVTNYALYILIGFVTYVYMYLSLGYDLDLFILSLLFSIYTLVFKYSK